MNPLAPDVKACPYPLYDQLRAEHPVMWSDELEAWLVTGYAQAEEVLRDHRTYSSKNSVFGGPELDHPEFPSMINADEPKHMQLRSLAAKAFTPRTLDALWEPRIRELTSALLDAVERKATFNLVADLAFPLPVTMIAEIIGIESEKFAEFKLWSDMIAQRVGRLGYRRRTEFGPLQVYFAQAIADRRAGPRDDLVTRLVQAEIDGERLTDVEIIAFLILLLVAGNETTTNLIATAIRGLVTHPEQTAKMRAHPELIDGLIEEALRWDAPIQGFYRRATTDTVLAGRPLRAGEALFVLYAAANRDPDAFALPDAFDIERGRRDHAAFGMGSHYCLGANLARLEARISLEQVLDRFETLTPVEGHEEQWRDTPFFRGLAEYPLQFTLRRR